MIEGKRIMHKLEKILFWCILMGFAIQLIWMGMILFGGQAIYSLHSNLWHMDELFSMEWFMRANFIGIGMWKMAVILFFAIPWLAMKIAGK